MFRSTLRILGSTLLLAISLSAHGAETRYISDELRVPLRKTPCNTCSILHQGLVAGTKLTLHKSENGWANVSTKSGLTGWLPTQYLLQKPIARDRLNAAEANTRMIAEENIELKNKLSTFEGDFAAMENQNAELIQRTGELETELLTIKKVSGNAMALQEQNEKLIKQNRMLQSEVDVLTATKEQLASDDSHKWFLYGGLTVFLGAILAILLPQLRPRKRFTEWG